MSVTIGEGRRSGGPGIVVAALALTLAGCSIAGSGFREATGSPRDGATAVDDSEAAATSAGATAASIDALTHDPVADPTLVHACVEVITWRVLAGDVDATRMWSDAHQSKAELRTTCHNVVLMFPEDSQLFAEELANIRRFISSGG